MRVRPIDVDCWLGRIFARDAEGVRILFYADAEYLIAAAELPPEAVINS